MKLETAVLATLSLSAFAAPARGDVIVVNAAGGGDFTQLQTAVDAALDGDTILIKPGNYSDTTVTSKSLTIIGEGDPEVSASAVARLRVNGLAVGQVVTVARLVITPVFSRSLEVTDCAGAIRVSQCVLPQGAARLTNATDIAFTGCTIQGLNGLSGFTCLFDTTTPGLSGISGFINNQLALYECSVVGGNGGNGGDSSGFGAIAVSVPGFVFASRSNIHGGHGGDTCYYGCPSNGGHGIHSSGGWSGWIFDCMVSGGTGGSGPNPDCPATLPGLPFGGLNPFQFAVPSIGFTMPSIATEGTWVQVTFTGPPGARVFLNDELTTTFAPTASWRGVLLAPFAESLLGPAKSRRWGTIPASGELVKSYQVPMLAPGEEAQTRFLQAYRIGPNGLTLGTFRTLTVLDSAF